ncbi:major facilitator superfamily domain-containing protein [Lophiotrema nucula]|uniref:Major facilitator superfamily domain-containing protein n=1 Tax=Lophiotrema nucula TaxID=690887 RepID=A0A6A5ZJJ0_9PLEO|nr:major facilitator superfamily domain-containing protein [Lophiotrema nucula]
MSPHSKRSTLSPPPTPENTTKWNTRYQTPSSFVVSWDEPENQDPQNPQNWLKRTKWTNIIIISVVSFLVPLVSSMLAPAVQLIAEEFNTTSTTFPTFVVSIFVLGFASGPLILAPLSEIYGRVKIYHSTNVLFIIFIVLCALSRNAAMLLASRFLSGFVGVATIAIGPGTIADIMRPESRGKAVSIWAVGTILGPMIGPIIGGYVTEVAGWRWMFWAVAIATSVITIVAMIFLRETYPPVLLERKAVEIRRRTGDGRYRSRLATTVSFLDLVKQSILRPMKMLLCYPVVTILCMYVAVLYGTLYLLFTTYSFVFEEIYGFSTFAAGLVFLAGGFGTLLGLFYIGYYSDRTLRTRAAAGRTVTPEDRLPLLILLPGALTFPMGLFIYGWGAEYHVHWMVPQIGTAVTGFGSILIFTGIQTYLIDAFEGYSASAIGANAVLRGLAGALIPLGGLDLYRVLGWGWGNSLLAFVALAFAPIPVVVGAYGARLRGIKLFDVKIVTSSQDFRYAICAPVRLTDKVTVLMPRPVLQLAHNRIIGSMKWVRRETWLNLHLSRPKSLLKLFPRKPIQVQLLHTSTPLGVVNSSSHLDQHNYSLQGRRVYAKLFRQTEPAHQQVGNILRNIAMLETRWGLEPVMRS